jgi:hypothetical protein
MSPVLRLAAILVLILLVPHAAAHEIGVLNVEITAHPGGRVETLISSDVDHLTASPSLGLRAPANPDRAALELLGAQLGAKLRPASALIADGESHSIGRAIDVRAVLPGDLGPGEPSSARIILVFAGSVPHSAATLSWSTTLDGVGQYLFRARIDDAEPCLSQWLKPGQSSDKILLRAVEQPSGSAASSLVPSTRSIAAPPAAPSLIHTVVEYTRLGFTHIIPDGLDHILFVLGLFLASSRVRPLLAQITAFTVAHSVSLALAMTGVVHLSASIVEPAIAASIVFVAVDNLVTPSVGWRRIGVVFLFGLIHGLGFAGVLGELGLPRGQFISGLAAFNVGVEAGQLAVIALAFAVVGIWRSRAWYRARAVVPGSIAIACVGIWWTLQRTLA